MHGVDGRVVQVVRGGLLYDWDGPIASAEEQGTQQDGQGADKQRGAGRVCQGEGMAWSNELEKMWKPGSD